jgi:hypothetical protein
MYLSLYVSSLIDRGFDEVVVGFEDGNKLYMQDVLFLLSSQNKSIVLLGITLL